MNLSVANSQASTLLLLLLLQHRHAPHLQKSFQRGDLDAFFINTTQQILPFRVRASSSHPSLLVSVTGTLFDPIFIITRFTVASFTIALFTIALFTVALFSVALFTVALFTIALFIAALFTVALNQRQTDPFTFRQSSRSNVK
ncbi:hypothetical protein BJ166DRAFT_595010 [Pestalotiopsis sp. NC0098]|nr:hypothetical protein BJ166DRAFT_595010 [Pestalotiopsis sp. NC0098]